MSEHAYSLVKCTSPKRSIARKNGWWAQSFWNNRMFYQLIHCLKCNSAVCLKVEKNEVTHWKLALGRELQMSIANNNASHWTETEDPRVTGKFYLETMMPAENQYVVRQKVMSKSNAFHALNFWREREIVCGIFLSHWIAINRQIWCNTVGNELEIDRKKLNFRGWLFVKRWIWELRMSCEVNNEAIQAPKNE